MSLYQVTINSFGFRVWAENAPDALKRALLMNAWQRLIEDKDITEVRMTRMYDDGKLQQR